MNDRAVLETLRIFFKFFDNVINVLLCDSIRQGDRKQGTSQSKESDDEDNTSYKMNLGT